MKPAGSELRKRLIMRIIKWWARQWKVSGEYGSGDSPEAQDYWTRPATPLDRSNRGGDREGQTASL